MSVYRAVIFDATGRISWSAVLEADDDASAARAAHAQFGPAELDLWLGSKRIGRVTADGLKE